MTVTKNKHNGRPLKQCSKTEESPLIITTDRSMLGPDNAIMQCTQEVGGSGGWYQIHPGMLQRPYCITRIKLKFPAYCPSATDL